jgi:hypothetical protein
MAGADAGLPSHTTEHNDGQGDRSPPAAGAGKVGLTHMAPDEDAHTHTYNDTDVLTGSRHQTLDSHNQAPSRDEITTNRRIQRQINSVRRTVAATKKPKAPAILSTDRVTTSLTKAQVNISELIYSALTSTTVNDDPRTYDDAMSGPLKHEWEAAILEEAKSIQRNETFTIIDDLHRNDSTATKPIGSKWVFKTKRNPDGSTRYKARLVIEGYEQTDYGETYAPVGKLTTFRLLISLAAREGWIIDHLDVVTAFLNPEVDDNTLHMVLPEGWPFAGRIVRPNKALYGLKQAPRLLYRHINAFLLSLDFIQSETDPNLYIRNVGNILLLLYVDDMLLAYAPTAAKDAEIIKAKLAEVYKITNLGPARQFLGIEIHQENGSIQTISHGKCLQCLNSTQR